MNYALVLIVAAAAWALATPIDTEMIKRQAEEVATSAGQRTRFSWKGLAPGTPIAQAGTGDGTLNQGGQSTTFSWKSLAPGSPIAQVGAGDGTLDQGPSRTRLAWNGVSPGTPVSQASAGDTAGWSSPLLGSDSGIGDIDPSFEELGTAFEDGGSSFERTKRQWDDGYAPHPAPATQAQDTSLGNFAFEKSKAESDPSLKGANFTKYGGAWGKTLTTGAGIFKIGKRQSSGEGDGSSLGGSEGPVSSFFGAGAGDGLGDWTPSIQSSFGVGSLVGGTAAESEGPLTESNPSLKGSSFRNPNSGVNSGQAAGSVFKTLGNVFGNLKFPDFGR